MSHENNSFFQRILSIFVFILFLNFFFFRQIGSTGFAFIAAGSFLFITKILKKEYDRNEILATSGLFISIVAFSVGQIMRANPFINGILIVSLVFTILIQTYILSSGIPMVRSLLEFILAPLYIVLSYIQQAFKFLGIIIKGDYKHLLPESSDDKKHPLIRSIILGLFIGIFVIGILVSMLSSADPIFASFIEKTFSTGFIKTLFQRVMYSALIGLLLAPFIILKRDSFFNSPVQLFKRWNFTHGMSVIMILVSIVMGMFLIIQWPYVFVSVPFETDLSKFGVATYSEYVRKGFIELLRIALFIYGLIWVGLIFLREHKKEGKSILPFIQSVVLVEFFIFLISIFRRVWLYQEYHGWSIIRVYGSFLLIWICGITLFLVLRHFWQKRWVVGEMAFTVIILAIVGAFNVEHFIVTNHPPTVNKRVDYVYLSRMSADGYEGWLQAYQNAQETVAMYRSQGSMLTRDQRRDIAYAGYVTKELTEDYHRLIQEYGTQEEQKKYVSQLVAFHKKAAINVAAKNTEKNMVDSYKYPVEEAVKVENRIKENKYDTETMFNSIQIYNNPDDFKYENKPYTMLLTHSFYSVGYYENFNQKNRIYEHEEKSELDKLFILNVSRKNAYDRMSQEITFEGLLNLQKEYFLLEEKIRQQPDNERAYDMDISLNSPLLD